MSSKTWIALINGLTKGKGMSCESRGMRSVFSQRWSSVLLHAASSLCFIFLSTRSVLSRHGHTKVVFYCQNIFCQGFFYCQIFGPIILLSININVLYCLVFGLMKPISTNSLGVCLGLGFWREGERKIYSNILIV